MIMRAYPVTFGPVRGWAKRRGLHGLGIIPYDQLTPPQWYELIALTQGQSLAQIQAYYSATASGSKVAVGAHALPQSAYNVYQIGGVVDAAQGGHYFQYGGGYVSWAQNSGAAGVNPWGMPAQAPTPQQVAAQYAAGQASVNMQMAAPVYSQPQNTAAVIAAYNQANPQAPVVAPLPPPPSTVVNPSPPAQSTTTGTSATSPGSAVSQANGTTGASGGTVGGIISSVTTGTDWISGIPNIAVIGAGAVVAGLLLFGGKR
jgi:hypothetical protein